jgi:hypothetical protein
MMLSRKLVFESHPWATALFVVGFVVLVYVREVAKRDPLARAEYHRLTGRIVFWACIAMMVTGAVIVLMDAPKP